MSTNCAECRWHIDNKGGAKHFPWSDWNEGFKHCTNDPRTPHAYTENGFECYGFVAAQEGE